MEKVVVKELAVWISKYKKELLNSSVNYSPSTLASYLFNLAQSFNAFYQNVRVIDAPEEQKGILINLVKATMIVMKDGLDKLGIDVVNRM